MSSAHLLQMTMSSRRQKHVRFALSAILLLLLQSRETLGLLKSPTTCNGVSIRAQISAYMSPLAVSAKPVVDETVSDSLKEDSAYTIHQFVAREWDEQFDELQSFHSEYGHCNFPQNPPEQLEKKYPRLKQFCQEQREEYKQTKKRTSFHRKNNLLVFDRVVRYRRMGELGFEFNSLIAPWYDQYHSLIQFIRENGHMHVKERDNNSLYRWVCTQRFKKSTGLNDLQIKLLDDIGFEWRSQRYDHQWHAHYQELAAFYRKHGHCRPKANGPLDNWCAGQRKRHRGVRGRNALSDEQISLLDKIEFPWKPDRHDSNWFAMYEELQRFQEKYGNVQPSFSSKLYRWMMYQRGFKESLSPEKIELLDKIKFRWEHKSDHQWPRMFRELVDYSESHGHLRVSQEDDPDLYEWMSLQRNQYHGTAKSDLTDKRIDKLEDLQFCWSLDWRERTWHEKYMEAVEFFKEHGHVLVQKEDNPSLHSWIQTQEKRYKEERGQKPLSMEELEMLEQVSFPFLEGRPRMAWNAKFADMELWRKENDGRFPTSQKDDPGLSRWLRQQRYRLRCAPGHPPLSDEQKAMLESINFPVFPNGKQNRRWYEHYDKLVEFRKEHGHFLVDRSQNSTLYNWCKAQRHRRMGNVRGRVQLSTLQIYLLERIDFPWVSDRLEKEWQENYNKLVQFQKEHGHLPPLKSEHPKLFLWAKRQKQRYSGTGGTLCDLSEHQYDQLKKIGFPW